MTFTLDAGLCVGIPPPWCHVHTTSPSVIRVGGLQPRRLSAASLRTNGSVFPGELLAC